MRTLIVISIAGLLGACASPDNHRLSVGSGALGDASSEVALPAVSAETPQVAGYSAGTSVTGLDRSSWGTTVVLVPNDHTEHHVHCSSIRPLTGVDLAGDSYPTLESALGVESSSGTLFAEWFFWPFREARDAVMGVGRLSDAQGGLTYSPRYDGYQRTPAVDGE